MVELRRGWRNRRRQLRAYGCFDGDCDVGTVTVYDREEIRAWAERHAARIRRWFPLLHRGR